MTQSQKFNLTVKKVSDALEQAGTPFRMVEFTESTRTAQEAADRVGCELGQIVKSLIFKGRQTGNPILVLTSGVNRVNEGLIGSYAGEQIERADAQFVRQKTGYAIGGVPPIAHLQKMDTYMDEDLFCYQVIWAAGGTPYAIFEIKPGDLQVISRAIIKGVKLESG